MPRLWEKTTKYSILVHEGERGSPPFRFVLQFNPRSGMIRFGCHRDHKDKVVGYLERLWPWKPALRFPSEDEMRRRYKYWFLLTGENVKSFKKRNMEGKALAQFIRLGLDDFIGSLAKEERPSFIVEETSTFGRFMR